MSKQDKKLEQKSPAKTEISGALDEKDLEKVTGGDKAVTPEHEKATGGCPTESLTLNFTKIEL